MARTRTPSRVVYASCRVNSGWSFKSRIFPAASSSASSSYRRASFWLSNSRMFPAAVIRAAFRLWYLDAARRGISSSSSDRAGEGGRLLPLFLRCRAMIWFAA